jgi:hypothetical protein
LIFNFISFVSFSYASLLRSFFVISFDFSLYLFLCCPCFSLLRSFVLRLFLLSFILSVLYFSSVFFVTFFISYSSFAFSFLLPLFWFIFPSFIKFFLSSLIFVRQCF